MTYKSIPPNDPLLVAVCEAKDALHALSIEVHYLSCGDVVGRLPRPSNEQTKHHSSYRHRD